VSRGYLIGMMYYIEVQKSSDEELVSLIQRYFGGEQIDPRKVEFAIEELRRRGYKPVITFEKKE